MLTFFCWGHLHSAHYFMSFCWVCVNYCEYQLSISSTICYRLPIPLPSGRTACCPAPRPC